MEGERVQNRMVWTLATLAAAATLAAVGVGFNGYRNTPRGEAKASTLNPATPGEGDADPLAPRLFDQSDSIRIHVAGAVKKPGVYTVPTWFRVIDAVKKAGGATAEANLDAINLADRLKDAEQLRVPYKGRPSALQVHRPTPEPLTLPRTSGGRRAGRIPAESAPIIDEPRDVPQLPSAEEFTARPAPRTEHEPLRASVPRGPINLNSADQQQLESLPGIGPVTAKKILAYRRERGGFLSPDDLMNVQGIGPKRYAELRGLVETR
jgi:competence protein ComEA